MILIFLFVRYLRRTSNYLEKITLFDPTHVISIAHPVAVSVETPRTDNGDSLEK